MWTNSFYIYEHVYTHRGGRSFKTFLKENYTIALESQAVVTYLLRNVKHGIEHDIASNYGDIKYSCNL